MQNRGSIPEVLLFIRLKGRTGVRVTGLAGRRVFEFGGLVALADFGGEKLAALAMVPPV